MQTYYSLKTAIAEHGDAPLLTIANPTGGYLVVAGLHPDTILGVREPGNTGAKGAIRLSVIPKLVGLDHLNAKDQNRFGRFAVSFYEHFAQDGKLDWPQEGLKGYGEKTKD